MQNKFFSKSIIIDILEKPDKNSNISSQIIYGEKFKLISEIKNFYKIKNLHDNYIGFVSKKIKKNNKFEPTHKTKVLKSRIFSGSDNLKKKPTVKCAKPTRRACTIDNATGLSRQRTKFAKGVLSCAQTRVSINSCQ